MSIRLIQNQSHNEPQHLSNYAIVEKLFQNPVFIKYFPYFAGLFFLVLFLSLGIWQLERAQEKTSLFNKFDDTAPYKEMMEYGLVRAFDRIKVSGKYLPNKQILIENVPRGGRLGYFVISPFMISADGSTLLINRGWVAKPMDPENLPSISIEDKIRTVKGHAGHLPKIAIRTDPAFAQQDSWPRIGRYPSISEIQNEIQMSPLPIVLLLSPDSEDGFHRSWKPAVSGPKTHYGYALQWFAFSLAVICVVAWVKKGDFKSRTI